MNDLAYLWEEEDPIRDRFALFLVISIGLHLALRFMPVGARDAQDADVRDVARDEASAAAPAVQKISFDIREAAMALPSFAPALALARKAFEPAAERLQLDREELAPPAGIRRASQGLSVADRASQSETPLLEAPKAPKKELPDPRHFKPRTFREDLKRAVVERQRRALVKLTREPDKPRPDKRARPRLHPKKSLLKDPIPSPKPETESWLWMAPMVLLDREEFEPEAQTALSLTPTEEARLLALDASALLKPLRFGEEAHASHKLLPLPRLSIPKAVSVDGSDQNVPPGWTAAGLGAYKRGIQQKLMAVRTYPRQSIIRKEQGIVTVRFVVNPTGELEASYISISTDFPRLDAAGLLMMRKAATSNFPKFPAAAKEKVLFEVDIVFSLVGD